MYNKNQQSMFESQAIHNFEYKYINVDIWRGKVKAKQGWVIWVLGLY